MTPQNGNRQAFTRKIGEPKTGRKSPYSGKGKYSRLVLAIELSEGLLKENWCTYTIGTRKKGDTFEVIGIERNGKINLLLEGSEPMEVGNDTLIRVWK